MAQQLDMHLKRRLRPAPVGSDTADQTREANRTTPGTHVRVGSDNIPARLVVDLNGLDIGDSIHIGAVSMPENARPVIQERDFTLASIAASSAVKEEAAQAAQAAAIAAAAPPEEPAAPAPTPPAMPGAPTPTPSA